MKDLFTENIRGVQDLVESGTNKINTSNNDNPEGVASPKIDVLDLPMSDEELLELANDWESIYKKYEPEIKKVAERNLRSYLGRNKDGSLVTDEQVVAANLQFEAEETFLPATIAKDPDPVVFCDNTPEGNEIADSTRTMLQFHAEQLILRRKLSLMVRQWSIYQLAVLKHGWNPKINDVAVENRKIKNFIFDPDGYVDAYGDFSSWLGERIEVTAEKLIELFPKKESEIRQSVGDKLGTKVVYTEFWTDEYCFSKYKGIILDKHKNEYFNYEETTEEMDEFGAPITSQKRNHFAVPKKPYTFLSVFSLQERPHDVTGLIEQNIPNQNKITKRTEQIDINVSRNNNSVAYSMDNFNQETAKQASEALTNPSKGQVLIPEGGPAQNAIIKLPANSFPEAGFKDLENSENHLRSSWGIQGLVSQQAKEDQTARGMILNQTRDTSRIGVGIGDAIEQVAQNVFNWLVQLYMVFYDEEHFGAVMGVGKATQFVKFSRDKLDRQLVVSVSQNSMKPKDEISNINMAQSLFDKGAIGPKTLLETLNFPNAEEAAADGVLWKVDPQMYIQLNFPELWTKMQGVVVPQATQPTETIPPITEPTAVPMQNLGQAMG